MIQRVKNRCYCKVDHSMPWTLNLYLIIGSKYNYLIDTGLGSESIKDFLEIIQSNGLDTIIINTHFHWDHIWGNDALPNLCIIAHNTCPSLIEEYWDYTFKEYAHYSQGEVKKVLPNVLFEKELYFPEDQIRLIYTPGHTKDSISIIDEKEKILYIGDNIGDDMQHIIPELDCEKSVYLDSLRKIAKLDFEICLSGHNEKTGKETIIQMIKQLEEEINNI